MNLAVLAEEISLTKKRVLEYAHVLRRGEPFLKFYNKVRGKKPAEKSVRFVHACFDESGQLLVLCDVAGNAFVVDLLHDRVWSLPKITRSSVVVVKFSNLNNSNLLVGNGEGVVFVVELENGKIVAELIGHQYPVFEISFSSEHVCLTTSHFEAILWNLKSYVKIQVLNMQPECNLKHVLFVPVTNKILACFEDNTMMVWKYETFDLLKEIAIKSENRQFFKSVAFTKNGRIMIFSGNSSQIFVFNLDTWSIEKNISLPDRITTIKQLEFVPKSFDGGCNKILAILAGNGILYFYDMELNSIISCVPPSQEIIRFHCSNKGDNFVIVTRSGEVNVYKVANYTNYEGLRVPPSLTSSYSSSRSSSTGSSFSSFKSNSVRRSLVQEQIKEILDTNKLRCILEEFGQYPEAYRIKIWTRLLKLPNNVQQYNSVINHHTQPSFENLQKDYPLENKVVLKNLKKLLSNLVTWCSKLAHVTYLPIFVFPFVKFFQNEPVVCFEVVCTIIINWCQYWFEYFPLPPLNILAMLENILHEHDVELVTHFTTYAVTAKIYGWIILESAFSEVLSVKSWCALWDHVFSNEPSFLLMCVVAYSLSNRRTLLSLNTMEEFEKFYRGRYPTSAKRLIAKAYWLLKNTRTDNHPRRYLNAFEELAAELAYPTFWGFPESPIDDVILNELGELAIEQDVAEDEENEILIKAKQGEEFEDMIKKQEIEDARVKQMESVCRQKISEERARVKEQHKRLLNLRKKLQQDEINLLNQSRQKLIEKNSRDRRWALEKIMSDVERGRDLEELKVMQAESYLIKRYSELVHHKMYLEKALNAEGRVPTTSSSEYDMLKNTREKLNKELREIRDGEHSKKSLKHLNVAAGIAAMDSLILRIEMELAKRMTNNSSNVSERESNKKVVDLEEETVELMSQVAELIEILKKDKVGSGNKMKTYRHDGYTARPSSPVLGETSSIELDVIDYCL